MKLNLTLKLDEETIREARILAAEQNTSISALVAAQIEKLARERKDYESAKKRAVERMRKGFDLGWTPPKSRDELHER